MSKRQWVWLRGSAVVALAVYVLLWIGWREHWPWLHEVDDSMLDPAHTYGEEHKHWTDDWNTFCNWFGPWGFQAFALLLALVEAIRRRYRIAAFLVLVVVGSFFVVDVAKNIAERKRPHTMLVHAGSWSFPSGHTLGTMAALLGFSAVALVLFEEGRSRRWAWIGIALGSLFVLAIGAARIILNVHHPTDVVAGWLLAYVWFVLCLPILTGWKPVAASEPVDTPEPAAT